MGGGRLEITLAELSVNSGPISYGEKGMRKMDLFETVLKMLLDVSSNLDEIHCDVRV